MLHDLYTPQGEALSGQPWNVYPRPQLRREGWLNLNGIWEFTASREQSLPEAYDRQILVPFTPESLLSGIHGHFGEEQFLYYRRRFTLPEGFLQEKVLLHFGAVDQEAEIYVNQRRVGSHLGGYNSFSVDITAALQAENELVVRVRDDLRDRSQPYGKQTLRRGGMWYTPVSGIWQTVWLESVPKVYIASLTVETDMEKAVISVFPPQAGTVTLEGRDYPMVNGSVTIAPEEKRLWSPEDPQLYTFTVTTAADRAESYFALRSIEAKAVNGTWRLCLNGKPYFFHGLLDQGYWSDGIYTPASPECYAEDILAMKALGFNTLRKHIKVEPEQFYYDCDRLGMVVFQDMVNNGKYSFFRDTALPTVGWQRRRDTRLHRDNKTRDAFIEGMKATVRQLKNHPSILYWTIFNEGWGQFDSDRVFAQLHMLDSSRIIDSTSGWFRRKKTHVDSRHIYFGSWKKLKKSDKPLVLSEFGGYACAVRGHLFNPEKAYGYKTCKTLEDFQAQILKLYEKKVLPAVKRGLCAAICTQVSDVEDEINGFLTYDRRVTKADPTVMTRLAEKLQEAIREE